MSFECGQQRVMRLGWERPGSPAFRRVLTNRMREFFTYGSVGGAGATPAPTRQSTPGSRGGLPGSRGLHHTASRRDSALRSAAFALHE